MVARMTAVRDRRRAHRAAGLCAYCAAPSPRHYACFRHRRAAARARARAALARPMPGRLVEIEIKITRNYTRR